jgi:hypothetical protein
MTDTHLQAAIDQIKVIEERMKDREKEITLLTIQQDTDKALLKVLSKGLEKMKAENAD